MDKKIILITGASQGIGALLAKHLAKQHQLVLNYLNSKRAAHELVSNLQARGVDVVLVQADISTKKGARKIKRNIKKEFGKVDAIINNAGMVHSGDSWQVSRSDFKETMMVNLYGALNISQEITPLMKKGVIINISSVRGLLGAKDVLSYAAAKAGVINLTKSMAKILAPDVRVNAVAFGMMNVGMSKVDDKQLLNKFAQKTLLKVNGSPNDVIGSIDFLLSNQSQFMTGQTLVVDGGVSLKD